MRASRIVIQLLLSLSMLAGIPAGAAEPRQQRLVGGLEVYYGVTSAEAIRSQPSDQADRSMHGGVSGHAGQYHLNVSLFDAKSHQRVSDAKVIASVGELGLAAERKPLEPMTIAGTISFGNYFRMSVPGTYRIELEIQRTDSTRPVKAKFDYSHSGR